MNLQEIYIKLRESEVFPKSLIPEIVYHGTNNNFDHFDIKHRTNNGKMYGNGIYFTSDIDYAKKYTKNNTIIKGYINIENPFYIGPKETLEYAIRKENPYEVANIYDRNGNVKPDKVTSYLKSRGYDGINIENKMYVIFNEDQFYRIEDKNLIESYEGFNLIEDWKQKELESYLKAFDKEMNHIDELEALCEKHNWKLNTLEEYRQIPIIFKQFRFNRNKDEFKKLAEKEVNNHFKKLQEKVEKYIGNIQKIKSTGNNGYDYEFIGDKGKCEVQVILAGGYNIQRLHTRWIIKK